MPDNKEQKIERAKRYPFVIPPCSYVFVNGRFVELVEFGLDSLVDSQIRVDDAIVPFKAYLESVGLGSFPDFRERIPVVAYGSNASYEQLQRKYSSSTTDVIIPVIKARLFDFDVVYAALLAGYGSVPATLQYSPETVVNIFVTYLSPTQLEQMHKTEGVGRSYLFGKLTGIKLVLENNISLSEMPSYLALPGCLMVNDSCVSLPAVAAKTRKFPQMEQVEMLTWVRDHFDQNQDLDTFILEHIKNSEIRRNRIDGLKQTASRFAYEQFEVLEG